MDAVLEPSMIADGGKGNENIGDYCLGMVAAQ